MSGSSAVQLLGRPRALVGLGRRHADVDDGDVRLVAPGLQEQVVAVDGAADDLEPAALQQLRDAFAEEGRVVGDHDAHGISPVTARPAAGGTVDPEPAAARFDPVGEASQASTVGVGAAVAVVDDRHDEVVSPRRSPRNLDQTSRPECFTAFASASQATK